VVEMSFLFMLVSPGWGVRDYIVSSALAAVGSPVKTHTMPSPSVGLADRFGELHGIPGFWTVS
jgi:hypothetical protein